MKRVAPPTASCGRTRPSLNSLLWLQIVHLEGRLLRWRAKPAFNALFHSGYQNVVAELLPIFFRVRHSNYCPVIGRRTSRVVDLAFREAVYAGMHRLDRRLVLLFRATGKVVYYSVCHLCSPVGLNGQRLSLPRCGLEHKEKIPIRRRALRPRDGTQSVVAIARCNRKARYSNVSCLGSAIVRSIHTDPG